MKKFTVKNIVLSGLFIAIGIVLPFFTGQIPSIGNQILPMHLPVMLCGFVCGWPYGLIVGFITPLLRSLMLGMPPLFPTALAMAFELAVYGCMTGILYRVFPKKMPYIYITLILSMIDGRIIWGLVSLVLYGLAGNPFTFEIFLGKAFINAIPGIIIQLVLVPLIVLAFKKAKYMENVSA